MQSCLKLASTALLKYRWQTDPSKIISCWLYCAAGFSLPPLLALRDRKVHRHGLCSPGCPGHSGLSKCVPWHSGSWRNPSTNGKPRRARASGGPFFSGFCQRIYWEDSGGGTCSSHPCQQCCGFRCKMSPLKFRLVILWGRRLKIEPKNVCIWMHWLHRNFWGEIKVWVGATLHNPNALCLWIRCTVLEFPL